jgi:hypothetical protein
METKRFEEILSLGETICIEFKRCGNGVESDVYETVCSFLNSFGGDIFLGVEDNEQVTDVSAKVVIASSLETSDWQTSCGCGICISMPDIIMVENLRFWSKTSFELCWIILMKLKNALIKCTIN